MSPLAPMRWWRAAFAAAVLAAGCSVKTGPGPDPVLHKPFLEVRRAGVRGGSYEMIWLSRGMLRRETRSPDGVVTRDEPIPVTPAMIETLASTLDRYGAGGWAERYSNPDVFDGVTMHVVANIDGREISTQMTNRGPAFGEDGVLTYSNYGLGLGEDLLRDLRSWFERPPM